MLWQRLRLQIDFVENKARIMFLLHWESSVFKHFQLFSYSYSVGVWLLPSPQRCESNVKSQADWALSLLTPTTELWLPKLGIRRYHQSKPEFWTPPELSDTRMVISVNLSFGNTASLWIQGGLGHPSLSPVKKRISRSS